MQRFRSGLTRYGGALLTVGVATGGCVLLEPLLKDRAPYNVFAATSAWVAYRWGVGPGLVASAAGVLITCYGFIPPRFSFQKGDPTDMLQLALYAIFGVGLSIAAGTLRRKHDETLHELSQRVEELSTVMDLAPVAIWVAKDPECRVIVGNRMANALHGAHEGENVSATTHPEVRRFYHDGVELMPDQLPMQRCAATNCEVRDYGMEVVSASGVRRYLFGGARPLRDAKGNVRGSVSSYLDLSEIKRAESELRARSAALSRSLNDLQHFTFAANHDLQEPLRMISAYAELLAERVNDPDAVQFTGYIREGATRMRTLIDDLLEYSRVSHDLVLEDDVDLRSVLSEALIDLRLTARDCGAELVIDALPLVRADRKQMVHVFENLIGNALKYRHPDRPPVIRVTAALDGNFWTVCVEDNGIGFDSEYAEQILEPFQRLHNRRDYPGSGLGLAICKRVIEQHAGRIWARGWEGAGAAFCFTLPASAERSGSAEAGA